MKIDPSSKKNCHFLEKGVKSVGGGYEAGGRVQEGLVPSASRAIEETTRVEDLEVVIVISVRVSTHILAKAWSERAEVGWNARKGRGRIEFEIKTREMRWGRGRRKVGRGRVVRGGELLALTINLVAQEINIMSDLLILEIHVNGNLNVLLE